MRWQEELAVKPKNLTNVYWVEKEQNIEQLATKKNYTFSFTGASAIIAETLVIIEEYNRLSDWKVVEKSLLDNNLLNKVKQAKFNREFSEIKKCISLPIKDQLQLMIQGSLDAAKAMILLFLVKAYSFLLDFIVEVIRNKYLLFDTVVSEIDYIKFVNSKSLSHNELNSIREATAKKVKQVIKKLLKQVGLITQAKNDSILKPIINSELLQNGIGNQAGCGRLFGSIERTVFMNY